MFTVEILDAKDVRRVAAIIDTADTFDAALIRYAEIAWEDQPAVLLGRAVIIREGRTGDVRAVGAYRNDSDSDAPVLCFYFPLWGTSREYWHGGRVIFHHKPDVKRSKDV
jgi:hypothetical protein